MPGEVWLPPSCRSESLCALEMANWNLKVGAEERQPIVFFRDPDLSRTTMEGTGGTEGDCLNGDLLYGCVNTFHFNIISAISSILRMKSKVLRCKILVNCLKTHNRFD